MFELKEERIMLTGHQQDNTAEGPNTSYPDDLERKIYHLEPVEQ